MKTKTLLIIIVVSSILVTGCRHYRRADHSDHRHSQAHLRHHLNDIADDLNLTGEQLVSLEQLLTRADGLRTTAEARERLRQLFASEFAKPAPDPAALQAELNRELDLIKTAGAEFVHQAVAFHGSLDTAQRRELSRQLNTATRSACKGLWP